ncbi:FAD-binding domain-containing protein [Crassisporium funariophilum]|nr:FAD-binding domain-containing protein [Crassisporium funariophilum]KAF8163737.1 FAD-binding domain-containing protein [Crassisporium funariophilum]
MFNHLALSLILTAILASAQTADISQNKGPTAQDWANLNATVGGRLAPGIPWPEPCFSSFNGNAVTPNQAQCTFVQQNFFNNHLNRSQVFGGFSATQYESCMSTGDQCELDWTNPTNPLAFAPPSTCKQGSIPNFFIDVKNQNDVIAAFKFSKSTGVPLVIKNTGHDFKGRSSGPGTLALWMHNMKYINKVPKFVPEGCSRTPGQSAITFGAGQQFQEIFQFAHDNNLIVVGGSDQSVGAAGGWGQGGGHSSLTPVFGMGADRTLQYKVVTPDGAFRTVNACQNEDLFFALRGGGGGTFGVVLEATMMASPADSFTVANINWPPTNANLEAVLAVFLNNATSFAQQGWGGYLTPSIGNLILTVPTSTLSVKNGQKAMQTLIDVTKTMGGVSNVTQVATFLDWFNAYVQGREGAQDNVGLPNALTSRLIPQKNHATAQSRAQLSTALISAFNNTIFSQIHFTTPFGFKGSNGSDTSVNPIWRTSLYQVILVNTWFFDSTLADRQAAYAQGTKAANFLRAITPSSGAYHNEADIHEPNHEVSFWGSNVQKLNQIKSKYDPDHLLDCWHCIGWKGLTDPRYKCYI